MWLMDWEEGHVHEPAFERTMTAAEALYRGAAADLDAGFGSFLDALEGEGFLESGYVAFTSDHGEGFYEHGLWTHCIGVWNETVRVPLLVHGPDLAARRETLDASLIDLARTLTSLAKVAPAGEWEGQDLFAPKAGRPVLAFECNEAPGSPYALISGGKKVILAPEGELSDPRSHARGPADGGRHAFDLTVDPGERDDLSGSAGWDEELVRRSEELVRGAFEEKLSPPDQELDEKWLERLRELGYVGD